MCLVTEHTLIHQVPISSFLERKWISLPPQANLSLVKTWLKFHDNHFTALFVSLHYIICNMFSKIQFDIEMLTKSFFILAEIKMGRYSEMTYF